jgi:predicted 3-demethylubiquinone-9 3-methyltransferase (glyoxalase superfamily)
MQKITPYLWFDNEAGEAADFYVSVFSDSKINSTSYYPEAAEGVSGKAAGSVMTVEFQLEGQNFVALNGGKVPGFEFTSAISLLVSCETQEEIDSLWSSLSAVPEAEQCGWLKDKFGITWQIVPSVLGKLLQDPDKAKVERVTAAFLKMKKFDIAELKRASEG